MTELNDVRKFHKKFDMVVGEKPGHLSERYMDERIALIQEEFNELWAAADDHNLADQVDALLDMVYVIKGTATAMGLSDDIWDHCWNEVQRANMSKERGIGPRGNLVDCTKPKGWEPPRLGPLLKAGGYDPCDWFTGDGKLINGRENEEDR